MSYQTIEFSLEAGVARITLNRPERLNAFNIRMHTEIADALSQIEANTTTRVLLLTGAWAELVQQVQGWSQGFQVGV